jgi:hypothetical protein
MTYKQVQALAQDMKRSGTPDDELVEAPQVTPQPAPTLVQGLGVPQQQVGGISQGLVAVAQMPSSAIRINGLRPAGELLDAAVAGLNPGSMGPV